MSYSGKDDEVSLPVQEIKNKTKTMKLNQDF